MIEVSNLTFSYNAQSKISFPAFAVENGKHLLLLGESGSGKTTLLHILGGLLRNYSGSVKINQTELSSLSESSLDLFRGQRIGFIFQKNHLINALSVQQNLSLAPYLAGLSIDKERITQVLASLGLENKRNSKVTELSQGQSQRVAIARAVLNKPSIIIADEPTSALDDTNCFKVMELLLDVAIQNNSTLVIATHDQRLKNKIFNQIDLSSTKTGGRV